MPGGVYGGAAGAMAGRLRVVAGRFGGRLLAAPAGRATRPTAERVREAVFALLASLPEAAAARAAAASVAAPAAPAAALPAAALPAAAQLAGHLVLDLFAGSGALGIEALSRGAAACTFVERDRAALAALRANLAALGLGRSVARVVAADVRRALQADAREGRRYTLVLADPPYRAYDEVRPVLAELLGRVLVPGAVVVVETAAPVAAGLPWPVLRERRYGDTRVTVLAAAPQQARRDRGTTVAGQAAEGVED